VKMLFGKVELLLPVFCSAVSTYEVSSVFSNKCIIDRGARLRL